MKKFISKLLVINFLLIAICSFNNLSFSEGNGSGGGQGKSLEIESISIENNAKDIPSDTSIDLVFNKNVVNQKVKKDNITKFILNDSSSQSVDIEVIMADDQTEPDLKNNITIKPVNPLNNGETYTLTVDKSITSKSGETMKNNKTLSFKTEGGDNSSVEISEEAEKLDNNETKDELSQQNSNAFGINPFILVVFGVVVIGFAGFILHKRRKK